MILVFIYLQNILRLKKKILYNIVLIFLVFVTSVNLWGQSLDHPVCSYKIAIDSTTTNPELLAKFEYLEENWYCLEDRLEYIEQLLINENLSKPEQEYLTFLKFHDLLNSYRTKDAEELITLYDNIEEVYFKGTAYYLQARLYGQQKKTIKSIESIIKAYKYFLKNNNPKAAILSLNYLLESYISINDYESATKTYSTSLALCEKNNYLRGFLHLFRAYGKRIKQYDLNLSKEILEKGYLLSLSDTSYWSSIMQVEYLRYMLRYEPGPEFEKLLNRSLISVQKQCLSSTYAILLTFKAHYATLNYDFDTAIYYNKKALEVRKHYQNEILAGYSFLNIANGYMNKKDMKLSKLYLDSAKTFIFNTNNLNAKRNYLNHLVRYFNNQKNIDSISVAYKKLLDINEAYFNEQQNELANKVIYKNELNSKLQQEKYDLELSKRKNRLVYVSIITVLSIIVIIFLVFRIRRKNIRINHLYKGAVVDKKALKEYQRELEQLKTIFKNAPKGFFIIDRSHNILYFNSSAQKMFRKNGNMNLKDPILSFVPEKFHESLKNTLEDLYVSRENREVTIELTDVFQQNRKISISISPMLVNDQVESTLFIITDITESQTALESEKQQRRILQTLINSVTESILLLDQDLKILLLNNTAAARFGSSVSELVGENYLDVLPNSLRVVRKEKIDQVFESKEAIVFTEDVDSYNSMISFYPNINKIGEIEFIAEFSQDITERKLASEQINSLRQKVLRSQMNPHFIFNSLNAIQSYVLKNEATTAVKYLNSFARLIRMILDSSRYDYITLSKEINILEHYLELQQLRFGDKFVYKLEIDESLDTDALLIPAMLAQPFIENSIEHGLQHLENKGTVKISFIHKNDSVVFKVIDNGIGRDASMKIQENIKHKSTSLSTKLFKERLHTLNKYSGQKITYNIVDLKDNNGVAKGTMVVINLPLIYKTDTYLN